MKILVVMDPFSTVNPAKDTSFGFLLAAGERDHSTWYCTQDQLYARRDGRAATWARRVQVFDRAHDFYQESAAEDLPLDAFDTVWMRKDPPVDRAYLHATYLLDLTDALVVNRPAGIRSANEKLYALHFPDVIPETMVTRDAARIRAWLHERSEPLIVKPVDGHGGKGIFLLEKHDRNVPSVLETLTHDGRQWVMAQAYLPAARKGDKRIILIDGEPRGAVLRVPRGDDNRGNMHVGGTVEACDLTPRELEICARIAPRLRADGLAFVGIDVIGDCLTEINVTSPTGIREIEALGGNRLGHEFVAWVEAQVAAR